MKLLLRFYKPTHGEINIDRSDDKKPPHVSVSNDFQYLRANGHNLVLGSKVTVHRWSKLHSFGFFQRNNDILHKHSIGYVFSSITRKVAFSFMSPQLSGNPLSFIGELTIDRENRIGKMKWPQQFGLHLEFGTPSTNLTSFLVRYNLPMFNKDADKKVDATVALKLASPVSEKDLR